MRDIIGDIFSLYLLGIIFLEKMLKIFLTFISKNVIIYIQIGKETQAIKNQKDREDY